MRSRFLIRGLFALSALGALSPALGFAESQKVRKVLIVSAEQNGVFSTGGLAHATSGLAKALTEEGIQTDIVMPFYEEMEPGVREQIAKVPEQYQVGLDFSEAHIPRKIATFSVHQRKANGVQSWFLKHEAEGGGRHYFYNVRGAGHPKIYAQEATSGESWGAFCKAVTHFAMEHRYDAVILNDWTAGLTAPFLQEARGQRRTPKIIAAIHNQGYQGIYPKSMIRFLGLKPKYFNVDGLEYYDQVNSLKAGLTFSDAVYTVSPKYSEEIGTARFGHGLEGVIQKLQKEGRVTGILNGIDNGEWDPSRPYHKSVRYTFTSEDLSGKKQGKAILQKEFNLPVSGKTPVIALTSRIADQKGFEYLIPAMEEVVKKNDVQFVVVGDGEQRFVDPLKELAARYPEKMHFSGFSTDKEKFLMAYSDFFLNGAKYEPSGLNQFFAMKNGTLPIVSDVGGLSNSVKEGRTGFLGEIIVKEDGVNVDVNASAESMRKTIDRALRVYRDEPEKLQAMQKTAMREDHSWSRRVDEFKALFDYLEQDRRPNSRGKSPSQLLNDVRKVGEPCSESFGKVSHR